MTLTWTDIDARWPDAGVLWDRDVAPTLDWEPRFRDRDGVLWADSPDDHDRPHHRERDCRCRVWIGGSWITHRAYGVLQMEAAAAKIAANRVDPRRFWRGFYNRDHLEHGRIFIAGTPWIDELNRVNPPRSDMADAMMYAARHMWRTGHNARDEYREMERGRWPTLRRVLARALQDAPPTAGSASSRSRPA